MTAGALCLVAPPLAAQEGGGLAGPVGAPVGGASLGAPIEPFATSQSAGPGRTAPGAPRVRLGPFGAPFAAPNEGANPEDPGRSWTITPSIAVDFGATDNVYRTRHDRRSDTFTIITPAILIDGATERVRAIINYAPSAQLYATYSDQNRVGHVGNGQILTELVPDRLFLDMRGTASLGTSSGGYVPSGVRTANRDDQVQTYSFQISPYYLHRFGSTATAQIGYAFQYSAQEGTTQYEPGATLPFFGNQDYIGNRGYLVVRSGEDFGRLALQGRVDGTAFSGTGIYDGAHTFVTSLEARYAITPTIAVLLEGGYENIEYGGTNPDHISDAIWSVGARLTPSPESFLVVRYGHRGGFNSPSVQGGLQLGGFTRLTGSYSESLATSASSAQDLLSSTTLDELGNPVDAQSGAPVLYANAFFPVQSGLFRLKSGAVTLTQSWPRDSISLSAFYQEQVPVSAASGRQISRTTSYYGGISWTHELTPNTATNLGVQIGRNEYDYRPSSDVIYASAAIYHHINERLSAVVRFIHTAQTSDLSASEYSQSVILAGLRQSF